MSRRPNPIPAYRLHRPTGQAVVTIRTADGSRRDIYLGKHGSPESKAEYEKLLGELRVAPPAAVVGKVSGITLNEVLLAFCQHAEQHYRGPAGESTRELTEYKQAVRLLREFYGHTPAASFGPLALKAIRQKMLDKGNCRPVVNARVGRVKRIFKWAASEELVPASVPQALATVAGLMKGKTPAREPEPVLPVAEEHVRLTMPFLRPDVRGLVELQLLTGMRPGEVCAIRPAEIDTSGPVWVDKPAQHKSAWRGKPRVIQIGPKGQELLRRFWPADPKDYFFSPRRSIEQFHAERTANRKTPKYPSHLARNAAKRKPRKNREPGICYTNQGYGKAVEKAVERQNREAARRDVPEGHHGPNLLRVPHWAPNQLRHAFGTDVRKRFGLEAAQVVLGHSRADVTQVYAERDQGLAERVAAEVG